MLLHKLNWMFDVPGLQEAWDSNGVHGSCLNSIEKYHLVNFPRD